MSDIEITYALATPEDYDEIIEHANFVFSYAHRPHEFKTLLPKAYGEARTMWPEHFVARENGKIRGLVGLLPFDMCVDTGLAQRETIHVGFIGTVSVHQYSRGMGHMKKCMAMSTEYALQHGLDLMALGGQRQRYEYYGYVPGGVEYGFRLTATNCRHALADCDITGVEFKKLADVPDRLDEVFALYDAGIVNGARTRERFAQICGSWCNVPYAILRGGELLGYCVSSQSGEDIAEIRLKAESELPRVLKAYLKAFGLDSVGLDMPQHMPGYVRCLARLSEGAHTGTNEMFMILNYPKVVGAYLRLKQRTVGRLADGCVTLGITGAPGAEGQRNLRIAVQAGEIDARYVDGPADVALDANAAQNMLLNPLTYVDMSALPACLRDWFPLPVYIEKSDCF